MTRKEKLAFAVVAALAMTSGGFAFGQSVNNVSSEQVIYACVTGVNGNITKVSNAPKTCPRGTTAISWNSVGPRGEQGPVGLQGIQGPKGDAAVSPSEIQPSGFFLQGNNSQTYYLISYPHLFWNADKFYYLIPKEYWGENLLVDATPDGKPYPSTRTWTGPVLYPNNFHLELNCTDETGAVTWVSPEDPILDSSQTEFEDGYRLLLWEDNVEYYLPTKAKLTEYKFSDFKSVSVNAGEEIWWLSGAPFAEVDTCKSFGSIYDFYDDFYAVLGRGPLTEQESEFLNNRMIVAIPPTNLVEVGELLHD